MESFCKHSKLFAASLVLLLAAILITLPQPAAAAPPIDQTEQVPSDPSTAGLLLDAQSIDVDEAEVRAAYQGCGGPAPDPSSAALEQRVVELTNAERAKQGLPPLKLNSILSDAARYHAADMAQDNYFEHDTFDRNGDNLIHVCLWDIRVRSFIPDARGIGENLAWGQDSPESVVAAWMASEGHRANILRSSFSEIGVSYHDSRWGQDFVRRADVYPVIINWESGETASMDVSLYAYGDWQTMRLRNDGGPWSAWQPFSNQINWQIDGIPGLRTVDIELSDGSKSVISSDSIEYVGPPNQEPIEDPIQNPESTDRIYLPLVLP